jgi:hypothetical protein
MSGPAPRGAHLLLQVRTCVLNDRLAGDFDRWYPGLRRTLDPVPLAAYSPPLCPALYLLAGDVITPFVGEL